MFGKTPSTPTILGDRQRRQNVQRRSVHQADCERLEHKCRKERTRRDKMKSSIQRLKDILRDSVNMSHQQFAKLENADILELVLLQLKTSQRPADNSASRSDVDGDLHGTEHFRSGMDLCATETLQFLQQFSVSPSSQAAHAAVTQRMQDLRSPPVQHDVVVEEMVVCAPLETISNSAAVADEGLLLDLRINGAPHQSEDQQELQQASPSSQHSPARPEVLEKIRRKIFERRQMRSLRMGNPLAEQRQRTADQQLDDGYDSDEALMWRPW